MLFLFFGSMLAASESRAQSCPSVYAGAACNAGGGSDICIMLADGVTWDCGLARNGGTSNGIGYAVWGFNAGYYSAWGVATNGNNFCCHSNDTAIRVVTLNGSPQADALLFQALVSGTTYNLDSHSSGTVHVDGKMYGHEGIDNMTGSDTNTIWYKDYMYGDSGDDVSYGGLGADGMSGGDGDDTMHGDGDDDEVCGDANTAVGDSLTGDAGSNDHLWGADAADVKNCGGGGVNDMDDANGTHIACSATHWGARPLSCP